MLSRLLPAIVLVTGVGLALAGWRIVSELRSVYYAETAAHLQAQAQLIVAQLPDHLSTADASDVDRLCKQLGAEARTRVTVILPSGRVLGDSQHDPATMDSHSDRPEVAEALQGRPGSAVRHSFTLAQNLSYAAVPVLERGQVVGVVRTAVPVSAIDQALAALRNRVILLGALVGCGVVLAGVLLIRQLARPMVDMAAAARRFADGELDLRVPAQTTAEAAALASALNDMAARLDEDIRNLTQQRNEREALLSSMVEGVVALDEADRVITLNRAAGELFGVDAEAARGRTLQEIVRNPAIQQLAADTRASGHAMEAEAMLQTAGVRYLQAHGTVLRGAGGRTDAVLIVLNDVTRLRRLEGVRRDFVANVSHELRTPITSIKGFVETLRDGALDDPEAARRFLGIVERQADRLAAIIEDLLALSRLEETGEASRIALRAGPVRPILLGAIEACQAKAAERGITVGLSCSPELQARLNPELILQAVANLIDNAVKYSPPGAPVRVEAQRTDGEVVIRVRDEGCGISAEDQERVFERFFRVDRARSRELGGTGLGLAIVKHIAQVHGGHVAVQSALGKGSLFSVVLPAATPADGH
jgi:two-component system phosphate regulon sensor histidine kinase PhoR